jgi:hypothetical protein
MGVEGDKGQRDDGRVLVGAMQLGNETYWLEEQVRFIELDLRSTNFSQEELQCG